MVHSGSLSLHTILEESSDEGDTTLGGGESSSYPGPRGCNVVTPTVPISTTPLPEGTSAPLAILMVPLWTTAPQLDVGLLPEQQQAY
jgi:hypothetical protein